MNEFIDKLILFICSITLYLLYLNSGFFIVPVIISIILCSLFFYYSNNIVRLFGILLFAVLCIFIPSYVIFLPTLLYDTFHTRYQPVFLMVPLLLIYHLSEYSTMLISFTTLFLMVSCLLKYKSDRLKALTAEYNDLRDNSVKMSLQLKNQNQELLKNQDYEVNLATLNERNRISKEIHDNIGHLLSRALLQVGALLVIVKEEAVREGLTDLKESLSSGMDQIRSSIHNMYDESIDLYVQIDDLVKNFNFCAIRYDYDIKNSPALQLRYCLIAITKEALANIIRHSDATRVSILLREHPAMYQLVIQDNGNIDRKVQRILASAFEHQEFQAGMGLHNIYDRVMSFHGNVNITTKNGFKLFITFPKVPPL